ncbi:MAG TPA: 4-hydroxythreonine-4-phosphate dehydrogenase PdxA [Beijerinckiaceae bacterium]|jgi:4-hydroxythreonine-4-phosphate dehydrogenase
MTAVPKIALVMGDAAGVGIELAARLLAATDEVRHAGVLAIGDAGLLRRGAEVAGLGLDVPVARDAGAAAFRPGRPELLDLGHDGAGDIPQGKPTPESGAFAMKNFGAALDLAKEGRIDAICFTPFNKQALKLAGNPYLDEIHWAADRLGFAGRCSEYNLLDGLWNCRVTSHIPLSEVASRLTREEVLESILDADRTIRRSGTARPRLAVAGLNPHAGEGGLFGREEIETIAPAVEDAKARGVGAQGPFPADTVWLRAKRGDFDAVVTMYHDQGQIALKLLGFTRGVTILGGMPIPICTPAHGTAYDIVGQGKADPGATLAAFRTAVRMAEGAIAERRRGLAAAE